MFRYEALAGEQVFEALVLCDTPEDAALLRDLLPNVQKIGGARGGEYGAVCIDVLNDDKTEVEDEEEGEDNAPWRESEASPLPDASKKNITITLLSDALLRDAATGQHTVSPQAIVDAALPGKKATCVRAFCRPELVGGFNRKWGLPLPQVQAVRKGSVVVVSLPGGGLTHAELLSREEKGIGERRAEGFGRIAFGTKEKRPNFTPRLRKHPRRPATSRFQAPILPLLRQRQKWPSSW